MIFKHLYLDIVPNWVVIRPAYKVRLSDGIEYCIFSTDDVIVNIDFFMTTKYYFGQRNRYNHRLKDKQ